MAWIVTNKGDQDCRRLADRHYTRQKPGNKQFCRPGHNLVLRTPEGDAVWVTWRGIRDDGQDAWECTIFRNESQHLSSDLIRKAVEITLREWGAPPPGGLITYVQEARIASANPGFCFKRAGWKTDGRSKRRSYLRLRLSA